MAVTVAAKRIRRQISVGHGYVIALLLLCATANADPLDTFGFGARATSLAGALTAQAAGQAAAFYNPASVARTDDVEAALGWTWAQPLLTLDGRDAGVPPVHGTSLGAAIPLLRGRVPIAFGLALYVPDQFVARIRLVPPSEPRFVLLDNDVSRVVAQPVLAVRPLPWLSVGAGASLLADAAGDGIEFDLGVRGGASVSRGALDAALPIRAAPFVGVLVEPHPRLRLGATYRGALALDLRLDVLARVDIAGAITGDTRISLRATNHYTPQRVTLGAAVDVTPELVLMAEVAWVDWSAWDAGAPDLRLLIALDVAPPLVAAPRAAAGFHDAWCPRLAAEFRRAVHARATLAARAGLAWEPSPVPAQTGLTSFADNDRVVVGLGAGVELRRVTSVLEKPLRFDLALGWHELIDRVYIKDQAVFPGRGFSSGGRIVQAAVTAEVRF